MENPIFTSKISKKEVITNFGIFLFVGIAFYLRSLNENFNSKCFAGFLILLFFVWTISRFRTFILYEDKLIIRRTFLTSKLDKVYQINKIKNILFYFQTGKFGGNKMIVYSIFIGEYDIYSINFNTNQIKLLIREFKNVEVNVVNELRD